MVELKEGQHLDPVLMDEFFSLGDDGILRYQDTLCVPDVDNLRTMIISEDHGSRYSIHPGSTKMYHDLKQIYWWDGMKKDIADYVAKSPNCQQVKAEHLKRGGLTQILSFRLRNGRPLIWTLLLIF